MDDSILKCIGTNVADTWFLSTHPVIRINFKIAHMNTLCKIVYTKLVKNQLFCFFIVIVYDVFIRTIIRCVEQYVADVRTYNGPKSPNTYLFDRFEKWKLRYNIPKRFYNLILLYLLALNYHFTNKLTNVMYTQVRSYA